jgi:hypothetical protein
VKASAFLGVKGSRVQISPARPKHSTGHLKLLHHYWARSVRSIVTRKSSSCCSISSIVLSNRPIRTMPFQ